MVRRFPLAWILGAAAASAVVLVVGLVWTRDHWMEKRVQVIRPHRLVRGAWQKPAPLRRLVDREGIKTIVTLTAINTTDPKYVGQSGVVRREGLDWIIIPMRGSRATMEQMAIAADLLADPSRQPVFFHCVAGHHRTSLAHAAYLIRHEGYSARRAWETVSGFPWARPEAPADRNDQFLIEEFARVQATIPPESGDGYWEVGSGKHAQEARAQGSGGDRLGSPGPVGLGRLERGQLQLRGGPTESDPALGANVAERVVRHPS